MIIEIYQQRLVLNHYNTYYDLRRWIDVASTPMNQNSYWYHISVSNSTGSTISSWLSQKREKDV